MATHTFTAVYKPGDRVIVGDDIVGIVTEVIFTPDRDTAIYKVEWFHNGSINDGTFYAMQLKDTVP